MKAVSFRIRKETLVLCQPAAGDQQKVLKNNRRQTLGTALDTTGSLMVMMLAQLSRLFELE
jgi:hypothetical protein